MKIHLSRQDVAGKSGEDSQDSRSWEHNHAYPTAEETALWVALNRAQRSIHRSMDAALKASGLPPLRWYDVLWSLERAEGEDIRPFELEKSLILEQSNLSRLLRRMIGVGLVEESTFKGDRRGKVLRITPKGCQTRKQMWKVYGPLIHKHISGVSKRHDLAKTARALESLFGQDGL